MLCSEREFRTERGIELKNLDSNLGKYIIFRTKAKLKPLAISNRTSPYKFKLK